MDSLTEGSELAYPATTEASVLVGKVNEALKDKKTLTVIFSTYQSIEVIHDAQFSAQGAETIPAIDLIICDEAHRTAGGHYVDEEEAVFTKVHKDSFVKGKKRLYMTATPKIYGETTKKQGVEEEIELYSMDDEKTFGKTFHQITFSQAVLLGSLVDYKVVVLAVNESVLGDNKALSIGSEGGLSVSNASKVIGVWRALCKQDLQGETALKDDPLPMKRAVGFAQVIHPSEKYDRPSSIAFAENFQNVVEEYKDIARQKLIDDGNFNEDSFASQNNLVCLTEHIDGSMCATEKAAKLDWLREEPEEAHCKILFNVRCLSEGVDVPALDAVIFLSPRRSQVDVVQTVGRVMRISPATKKVRGYVIIPIVTPVGIPADATLDNNKDFDTVWQVLKALKSIDQDFGSAVDGQLGKINSEKMEVICITEKRFRRQVPKSENEKKIRRKGETGKGKRDSDKQLGLQFARDEILEELIKARIVKKVGNRREWADWAADVGQICQKQIEHIKSVLGSPQGEKAREKFEGFSEELKNTLSGDLKEDEIIEMLGQHIVTKPVMDALFSQYPFTEKNPISKAMTEMLDALDKEGMESATKLLKGFYKSVALRAKNIQSAADRQTVILELFDKFFKVAFPKMRDKLGIVYTPVQVVDFINQSVADVLKKEFHTEISSPNVHILDPFTGTCTFITRLIQNLISNEKLEYKFKHDLHAQEIVPLAYYIASMNLEATYYERRPEERYEPNPVMIWTDTFADHNAKTLFKTSLAENNARLAESDKLDIRVIIGNPPYSAGQESQNDNNANEHYEELDSRLEETYVKRTNSSNKNKLYDSYIRAYRWASDRIKERGVIGFVTNAGWIESNSADGMRKCMAEEFNSIYVFHLKGGIRGRVGDFAKREGQNIFDIRTAVAIVILVKNPDDPVKGKIYFHAVDDYLSREEKLTQLTKAESIFKVDWERIYPDKHGDWLDLRDDSFSYFIKIGDQENINSVIFKEMSLGVNTNRDAWVYNSCSSQLKKTVSDSIDMFNTNCISDYLSLNLESEEFINATDKKEKKEAIKKAIGKIAEKYSASIKWSSSLDSRLKAGKHIEYHANKVINSLYRPFFPQFIYYDRYSGFTHRPGKWDIFFPIATTQNLAICVNQGAKASDGFIALMVNKIADLHFNGDSQCFPRYIYRQKDKGLDFSDDVSVDMGNGYIREDAITDEGLKHFQNAYPGNVITKDDLFYYIYGILHSPEYRKKYANNLSKELPRIPRVATFDQFKSFEEAGRKLADLHVNFEKQPRYQGVKINMRPGATFTVSQMKWGKIPKKTGNAAKDKTRLIYNNDITIENIPLEAQEYVVNKKSALDWLVERCKVSVDKDSGIVNDFNKYGEEQGKPEYPFDLFLKVITVSMETIKIVKSLPALEIHPLDLENPDK